ncbi:MAG: nicotinate (nicotinamide) nucleotide adenylyltransferase [Actinobacteria bacterium]|nr:nicotinate (nicotinamide) nucleotide adenylyltransferase [Actinomycetota bacterium]
MVERLGILGGTFDPVHAGHVAAAAEVRAVVGLDRVLLVPAGDPWQKRGTVVASAALRAEMVTRACEGVDGVECSTVEIERVGPSVTADTLEALGGTDRELFLVLGADAAANMGTWRRLEDTRPLATVVVMERAGEHADPPGPNWRWRHVAVPRLDISSSELRARIAAGRPVDGLVPPAVVRFIKDRGLYTSS